ncbi:MAG: hypothetical protein WB579_10100 [Bryobacteraceae bacterium]
MDTLLNRYRNISVLPLVIFCQQWFACLSSVSEDPFGLYDSRLAA